MIYHQDPMAALEQARRQLHKRPGERHIIRTERGYRVVDPRDKLRHYGVIAARMEYAGKPHTESDQDRAVRAWKQAISQQCRISGDQ